MRPRYPWRASRSIGSGGKGWNGRISFVCRPRVGREQPRGLFDVQRLFLLMEPHDGGLHRLLAIGRKRMPEPAERGLAPIGGARDDRDR